MAHNNYIRFYPAFDDGELYVDVESEFNDSELCKSEVMARNFLEQKRLTEKPDTFWFVAKLDSKVTVEWAPPKKKRVVKKVPHS